MQVVQCRHLIPALSARAARAYYMTARPIATHFLGMDALMTLKLNVVLIRKLRGLLMFLVLFLTCYPWAFEQPGNGRLVQELNICTVPPLTAFHWPRIASLGTDSIPIDHSYAVKL